MRGMRASNEKVRVRPAYRIQTDRLVVRCFEPTDAESLRRAVEGSAAHLRPWMPWAQGDPPTLDSELERVRRWRGRFDLGEDYVFGAFERGSGECIGGTGLHARAGEGGMNIGYWIRADRVRRGYATEIAAALTRVGFELLRLEFLEIECEPANEASAGVPRKLGYACEGVLRRRLRWPDGERRDKQIWSLFAEEYAASPSAASILEAYDVLGRRLL